MNYSIRRLALMKLAQGAVPAAPSRIQPPAQAPAAPASTNSVPAAAKPAGTSSFGQKLGKGIRFLADALGNRVSGRMGILMPARSTDKPADNAIAGK